MIITNRYTLIALNKWDTLVMIGSYPSEYKDHSMVLEDSARTKIKEEWNVLYTMNVPVGFCSPQRSLSIMTLAYTTAMAYPSRMTGYPAPYAKLSWTMYVFFSVLNIKKQENHDFSFYVIFIYLLVCLSTSKICRRPVLWINFSL